MNYAYSGGQQGQQRDRRVSLRMPISLFEAMERRAVKQGLPLSTIVRTAIQHEVEAR